MDKNRKIFIDGGAHFGESINAFLENYKTYDPFKFEIYSFEAHPELAKTAMNTFNGIVNEHPNLDIYFCEAALSTTSTGEEFYIGDSHYASTTRADKTTGGIRKDTKISVDSVDLNDFILSKFSLEDHIILKLDIEGGEYDILPHMIQNGSIQYINELYIEWHHTKLSQYTEEEHDALVEELKTKYNLEGIYWSAKYCDI
tara:strand:+ start:50 stop:649 length:600 start_codon:yes stop_codon:yes gene_type:complete